MLLLAVWLNFQVLDWSHIMWIDTIYCLMSFMWIWTMQLMSQPFEERTNSNWAQHDYQSRSTPSYRSAIDASGHYNKDCEDEKLTVGHQNLESQKDKFR